MVGFALFHGAYPIFLIGLVFVPLLFIWTMAALIFGGFHKLRFSWGEWTLLAASVAGLALLAIPYDAWQHFDVLVCGPGRYGNSFLNDAAAAGDLGLVKHLLAGGYAPNAESSGGTTPLSAAAVGNQPQVVEFLISKGADVNYANALGAETPLMAAAEMGHLSIVKLLLAHGADPCALNRDQHNAQGLAKKYHHQEIADYLGSHSNCPPPPAPPPLSCANQAPETCIEVH
jgi:hypothetical protein